MPFQNNSIESEYNYLSGSIQDAIKAEISNYEKFNPIFLENFTQKKNIKNYKVIYKEALDKKIDLVITGYFIEKNDKISIVFKVIDILTERMKIVYERTGNSGIEILDLVKLSTQELLKKMDVEITPYPEDISKELRSKQLKTLSADDKEFLIVIGMGTTFSSIGSIETKKGNDSNDSQYQQNSNKFKFSPVNPKIDFEIYGHKNNNYHGFGMILSLPFIYNFSSYLLDTYLSLNYSLGFKKDHFFSWGLSFFVLKYAKEYSYSNYDIMGILFGLSFNYRFMSQKYPFFVETGFNLYPSFLQLLQSQEYQNQGGPKPFHVVVGSYVSKNTILFPLTFNFGTGYFFNKEFGIFIKNTLYFINVKNYVSSSGNTNIKYFDFGSELAIGSDISFGVIYKNVFK